MADPVPKIAPLAWPAALFRVARDRVYDHFGYVPRQRVLPPGRHLSGRHLGLEIACNGSAAYVVYHRNFFTPAAYDALDQSGVAWLRLDELPRFNREVLPRVQRPFVLVMAESDWTAPSDFAAECDQLVGSGLVRRWFANNYDYRAYGEIVTPLPIGVKYTFKHTLERTGTRPDDWYFRADAPPPATQDAAWDAILAAAPPLARRAPLAFGDFWLNNSSRSRRYGESRQDIRAQLQGNPAVVFPAHRRPLLALAAAYAQHAFVISPHGGGLDCYRTWEALRCGCIVIVKRSPIDPLYAGLPVAIVDDWREISPARLEDWLVLYGDAFDRTRLGTVLSHEYWRGEIARAAAAR